MYLIVDATSQIRFKVTNLKFVFTPHHKNIIPQKIPMDLTQVQTHLHPIRRSNLPPDIRRSKDAGERCSPYPKYPLIQTPTEIECTNQGHYERLERALDPSLIPNQALVMFTMVEYLVNTHRQT